jgi:transcriptional regulator with XRE-family HTH domain
MDNPTFGRLLRTARLNQDQTLSDVAGAVGISVAYLSRIERDRELPPKDSVVKLLCIKVALSEDDAFAAARRFPPDLQKNAGEVIAAYRRSVR